MKKKIISLMVVMTMTCGLFAGCGSDKASNDAAANAGTESSSDTASDSSSDDLLSTIKERGYITVAMEGTWAPWTYHDEDDNLVGFDVEVAKAVADELGVDVQYQEGEWDGLLAGVQSGRYDIMVNGVGYTEERAQAYTFSDPYCYNKTALIVRGDNEDIKSLEDLKGKTTCNSANSTYQLIAEEYGANVLDVETLDGTLEMVLAGTDRADATLNAEASFLDYMNAHPDANLKIVDYYPESEKVCIIMPKGDSSDSLKEAINSAIEKLRADGTLSELSNKYFGGDIIAE
mgnify:FL=1